MDLLALSLLSNLIVGVFIILCVGLILIILLQKGRGGGMGAAFGGGGGAGSLLGTKTGDFLTWVTIGLVAGFLVLAVLMGKFMRPSASLPSLASPGVTTEADAEAVPGEFADPEADVTDEVSSPDADETDVSAAEDADDAESAPIPAEELADEMTN